ncbi:hypothetical protein HNP46_004317 [Pseudomonas nitritireducens]|uniref:Uncharacterized protein n=2 Tax=Pseudomonas nitroreducens TaxID=46680 RepID=A0A7W7KMB2_PSENT|nr:hypothetical protein [Pseudomonas nitritireducens]
MGAMKLRKFSSLVVIFVLIWLVGGIIYGLKLNPSRDNWVGTEVYLISGTDKNGRPIMGKQLDVTVGFDMIDPSTPRGTYERSLGSGLGYRLKIEGPDANVLVQHGVSPAFVVDDKFGPLSGYCEALEPLRKPFILGFNKYFPGDDTYDHVGQPAWDFKGASVMRIAANGDKTTQKDGQCTPVYVAFDRWQYRHAVALIGPRKDIVVLLKRNMTHSYLANAIMFFRWNGWVNDTQG